MLIYGLALISHCVKFFDYAYNCSFVGIGYVSKIWILVIWVPSPLGWVRQCQPLKFLKRVVTIGHHAKCSSWGTKIVGMK